MGPTGPHRLVVRVVLLCTHGLMMGPEIDKPHSVRCGRDDGSGVHGGDS